MSKYTNCPLTTHSFAWQRVGLVLSLSLVAAPLTPALSPMMAVAEEAPTTQTEIAHIESSEPASDADTFKMTVRANDETAAIPDAGADESEEGHAPLLETVLSEDSTSKDLTEKAPQGATEVIEEPVPGSDEGIAAPVEEMPEMPEAEQAVEYFETPDVAEALMDTSIFDAPEEVIEAIQTPETVEGINDSTATGGADPLATDVLAAPLTDEVDPSEAADDNVQTPAPDPTGAQADEATTPEGVEPAADVEAANDADVTNKDEADQVIPEVTLLYEANDGTDEVKTATVKDGSVVLPGAEALGMKAPKGKIFGGWYEPTKETVHFYEAGDTLTLTKEQADKLAQDKTPVALYALWLDPDQLEDATLGVAKTPVFFTSAPEEGGTLTDSVVYVPDSKDAVMDSVVAEPASGYVFNGWYKDGEKISDDVVLDPTTIDGVISTDDKTASPAVICASFVPESEAATQEEAPDLSTWRDPDSVAREQGIDSHSDEIDNEGPTQEDPNDDRNTDKDAASEPNMNDPELIDQAAQSLDDPKFNEGNTQVQDPNAGPQGLDTANQVDATDPTNQEGQDGKTTDDTTKGTSTTSTTKTTTPYSSYSHYTSSTTPYKSTYTGTTNTSTYKGSSYTPTGTTTTTGATAPYSSIKTTQLAQTSDNAIVALAVCVIGFVAALAGIAYMALRTRFHK